MGRRAGRARRAAAAGWWPSAPSSSPRAFCSSLFEGHAPFLPRNKEYVPPRSFFRPVCPSSYVVDARMELIDGPRVNASPAVRMIFPTRSVSRSAFQPSTTSKSCESSFLDSSWSGCDCVQLFVHNCNMTDVTNNALECIYTGYPV